MNDFIDLERLVGIILKRWWLLLGITALAAMLGYAISQRQTPVYEATTTVLVGQIFQSTNLERQDLLTSELVAQTYLDLARRQPVLQAVVDALGSNQTWQQLRKQISVELVEGTQLIQITVEANSPLAAQVIADEVAHQMILFNPNSTNTEERAAARQFAQQQLESLQARIESGQSKLTLLEWDMATADSGPELAELQGQANTLQGLITDWENTYTQLLGFLQTGQSPNSLTIIEPAQANPKAVSPQVRLIVILAGGLGALLALGLIFLLEFLNDTYKTPEEIERDFGLPVLGSIRHMGRSNDNSVGVYVSKHPRSPIAESFRLLRANLELLSADKPLKTILVTSCDKGVGKTTISANLASIMAQSNRETILLDADLHTSNIHKLMGFPNNFGLSDVLLNEMDITETLRFYNGAKSGVITSGPPPLNPFELLGSIKMDMTLARLTEVCDVVIIDAPPLFVSDALVLSAKVDGVLLVVRLGHTRKKYVKATLDQLNRSGANVIGMVLNGVVAGGDEYYSAYFRSNEARVGALGRLPAARNYWSGVVKKLGFAAAADSNGKVFSKEAGESYTAQIKGNHEGKPETIARTGEFCPNEDCPDYGKLQSETQKNIIKKGKSRKGGQRYLCKTCGRSYSENAGTIFFRKHTPEHEILETLALIAEGNPLNDLSQEKGFGKDTVVQWLQDAAQYPEQVNEALIKEFNIEPAQLDVLWARVGEVNGGNLHEKRGVSK